jgi:phage/plasmid primase-like uncharacterized protein
MNPLANSSELFQRLKEAGCPIVPDFQGRFQHEGNWWLWSKCRTLNGKVLSQVRFKSWLGEERYEWNGGLETFTPEEQAELEAIEKKEAAETLEAQSAMQDALQKNWPLFPPADDSHPYLIRKKVPATPGLKYDFHPERNLVVPITSVDGTLQSLERISPTGKKKMEPGLPKKGGLFWLKHPEHPGAEVWLAEGYATAASILLLKPAASGVACGFDAGNLPPVAGALREAGYSVLIAADHDVSGAGLRAAEKCGGKIVLPPDLHTSRGEKGTDWNDVHCLLGVERARALLEESLNTSIQILDASLAKKPSPLSERVIAETFLEKLGDGLIRQKESLFHWVGTHWKEIGPEEEDLLKQKLLSLCRVLKQPDPGYSKLRNLWAMTKTYIPRAETDRSMYGFDFEKAHFKNGTLICRRVNRKYQLTFTPEHDKKHYLTYMSQSEYRSEREIPPKNELFDDFLGKLFPNDPLREEKLEALQLMGGSMLAPFFPHLFFCYGDSGSGKSTIIKLLLKNVDPKLVSCLDPAQFAEFYLESIVGKQINANTELKHDAVLPSHLVKILEDGGWMPINRKNRPIIDGQIPPLHIYAANRLPKNREEGDAHVRRMTLIHFQGKVVPIEEIEKHYEDVIWEAGPEAVFSWAHQGLLKIIARQGNYPRFESSMRSLKLWQQEGNYVLQFLEAVSEGEVPFLWVHGHEPTPEKMEGRVDRVIFWDAFETWITKERVRSFPARNAFYAQLERLGITAHKSDGIRYYIIKVKQYPPIPTK